MRTLAWVLVVAAALMGLAVFSLGVFWAFTPPAGYHFSPPGEHTAEQEAPQEPLPEPSLPVPAPQTPVPPAEQAPPKPVWTILALGDSVAAGAGVDAGQGYPHRLAELWQNQRGEETVVINLARNGASTGETLELAKRKLPTAPIILVSAGGNNILQALIQGASLQELPTLTEAYRTHMEQLVATLTQQQPDSTIMLLGLYNPFSQWLPQGLGGWPESWNQVLAELAAESPRVKLVPVADILAQEGNLSFDLVHPSPQGHQHIAERHLQVLKTINWP